MGFSWAALKDAYYGAHAKSLLLIEYDLLAEAPEKVMRLVYEFLGEPWYQHDFENVQYDAPEFDQALGLDGLHRVRSKVALAKRQTILPPDLFNQYTNLSFWNDDAASAANVIRIRNSNARSAQ